MKVCSLYGAGFFYIPDTEPACSSAVSCASFNGLVYGAPAWSSDLGQQNRCRD